MEIIVIPRGTKIVDCRYNLESLTVDHHFQLIQMRKLEFSLFQAVDSSILMIIGSILLLFFALFYFTLFILFIILNYVMLCYVMLCYVMLCYPFHQILA